LIFIFPTLLFYPVLATYPASIALRGIGWRFLRHRLGTLAQLYPAIWVLGAITYASIILAFSGYFDQGVYAALASWTAYSVIEGALYLRAASRFRIRLLFASPVSLVGIGTLGAVLLISQNITWFTGDIRYGEYTILYFAGSACLVTSALITAIATLKIGAEKPTGEKELESLLITQPRASPVTLLEKRETTRPQPPPAKQQERGPTARSTPPPLTNITQTSLIRIEVISRGDALICGKCGATAPIGAEKCPTCGEPFTRASGGLRCPVCGAPFSTAKQLSRDHYVCGQCFSDLRIVARRGFT
ncbi:MAG: zinc ribbon domain-containing protein, partial [Aigarchaeota archaeon]|nr:zinc ribbon domain-containing protein [Candidatus Calditenuaceae archaeon]